MLSEIITPTGMNLKMLFCSLIAFASIASASSQQLEWVKFEWVGDSIGNHYMDKTAIDIPVKIDSMPYRFTMQLDLGASNSMLYGLTLAPYLQVNKDLKNKIDTAEKTWIDSKRYPTFKGINLRLDNVDFRNVHLGYYSNYGDSLTPDSVKTNSAKEIGTIGFDFFKDKVLVIDYPNQRMCVTDAIPEIYANKGGFIDCKFQDGVIMVPFTIGGKIEWLMFDTGSSIFPLSTNKKNAEMVAGENTPIIDSISVSSWGKMIPFYAKKINTRIKLGSYVILPSIVYYNNLPWDYFFTSHNIWGITGNIFFLKDVVVLDFKNQKFGVIGNK